MLGLSQDRWSAERRRKRQAAAPVHGALGNFFCAYIAESFLVFEHHYSRETERVTRRLPPPGLGEALPPQYLLYDYASSKVFGSST